MAFYDQLLSPSSWLSRFIHIAASVHIAASRFIHIAVSEPHFYCEIMFHVYIFLSWLPVSTFQQVWILLSWTFVNKFLCEQISDLISLKVELLGHIMGSVFRLLRNVGLFSKVVTSLYILISSVGRLQFLYILINYCDYLTFDCRYLTEYKLVSH